MPAQNATAQAQQAGQATGVPGVGIYTLGQLDMIGGSTITNEAMWTFNKNSVDQAVGILPGVTMTNTGGSRNEKDILVRGFDRSACRSTWTACASTYPMTTGSISIAS